MNNHTAYTGKRDPINCPANQPNPTTRVALKTKVFEALGEASMQWQPRPSGVFDSSGCERIGNELWDAINAALTAEKQKIEELHKILGNKRQTIKRLQEIIDRMEKEYD